ncbi:MAG TPA: DUF6602 domain-containing protein [Blastocatellia bacterium]|nr:DUF6602 domain-containing protein [Blastocatellia bacterium]
MKNLFRSLQDQLTANLKGTRSAVNHPGAKGEASEANWMAMLEAHLPKRYSLDKAFVVDSTGTCSEEIDIVIYDRQYNPVLYNHSRQLFIPAESVYAVLEVKQKFSRSNFKYASAKAASVRKLKRTTIPIVHAGGVHAPRPLTSIIAGILAYGSAWTPPMGDKFEAVLEKQGRDERLDLGCAISLGSFDVEYFDSSELKINRGDSSLALASFFLNLLKRLQKTGTVPAIDYDQYLKNLSSKA